MYNVLLIILAAFLMLWSNVLTFNRSFLENGKLIKFSWLASMLLLAASLGIVHAIS